MVTKSFIIDRLLANNNNNFDVATLLDILRGPWINDFMGWWARARGINN